MKKILYILNPMKIRFSLLVILMILISLPTVYAQDEAATEGTVAEEAPAPKKEKKPERPAFESMWWFDGQTGVVNQAKTLEFVIQHRFGVVGSSPKELLGLYGPSTNTRLGLNYSPIKNLNIGFGYTKLKYIVDLNAKYMILEQTKDNSMPFSLTYYGNMGIEVQDESNYAWGVDRMSYFNQLILMRRFSKKFSLQVAPSYIHYNAVKVVALDDGTSAYQSNDSWGLSIGARYKVSSIISIMAGYDTPLTNQPDGITKPLPSINFGIEIATSNHAFQVFFTNYNRIQPQEDFQYNQNDFKEGQWLIGFNITRLRAL